MINTAKIKDFVTDVILSPKSTNEKQQIICDFLKNEVPYYDWVGFYFKNGEKEELKLAEFAGEPTEHTIIPFGKGICGQVAVTNQNFVVQDVSEQTNYISCGWKVKSEIVIPIMVRNENIGQIDIDSHTPAAFKQEDQQLLEQICRELATYIE